MTRESLLMAQHAQKEINHLKLSFSEGALDHVEAHQQHSKIWRAASMPRSGDVVALALNREFERRRRPHRDLTQIVLFA
jgi:hypothetical protein